LEENKRKAAADALKIQDSFDKKIKEKTGGAAKEVTKDEVTKRVEAALEQKVATKKAKMIADSDAKLALELSKSNLKGKGLADLEKQKKKAAGLAIGQAVADYKASETKKLMNEFGAANKAKLDKVKMDLQAEANKKIAEVKETASKLSSAQRSIVDTEVKAALQEVMDTYNTKKGLPSEKVKDESAAAVAKKAEADAKKKAEKTKVEELQGKENDKAEAKKNEEAKAAAVEEVSKDKKDEKKDSVEQAAAGRRGHAATPDKKKDEKKDGDESVEQTAAGRRGHAATPDKKKDEKKDGDESDEQAAAGRRGHAATPDKKKDEKKDGDESDEQAAGGRRGGGNAAAAAAAWRDLRDSLHANDAVHMLDEAPLFHVGN